MMCSTLIKGLLVLVTCIVQVNSHGRLIEPAGRATAWRFYRGFPTDYNDNAYNCGGRWRQWAKNAGRCGICGEAWDLPKSLEKGGRLYRGNAVKHYHKGQTIKVVVEVTASHQGYMEFRICSIDRMRGDATNYCFNNNVLSDYRGYKSFKYNQGYNTWWIRLPPHLTCHHCVFQWRFHTGNSWGTDWRTGQSCIGCGPQEEFYGFY